MNSKEVIFLALASFFLLVFKPPAQAADLSEMIKKSVGEPFQA